MALNFSRRTRFVMFQVSPHQITMTSSLMMSGLQFIRLQSTGLSDLGQCWKSYWV